MLRACVVLTVLISFVAPVQAMSFLSFEYDEEADALRFVIAYRGTHPNHDFSIAWEACRPLGEDRQKIFGKVIDSDPRDPARQEFQKEVVVSLTDFACRPAQLSVGTFQNHVRTIDLPAKKSPAHR